VFYSQYLELCYFMYCLFNDAVSSSDFSEPERIWIEVGVV
jgi:hypothetical protein